MAGASGIGLPAAGEGRRLVAGLSAVTLLLWMGGSAIVPLLPSYLRAGGASPGLIGLVMAAYFAASVLTQYPAGRLTDAAGARLVVGAGLVVFAGSSAGFALASDPAAAIGFRALQGAGAGAVTVAAAAAIGALVPAARRGGAYGALYGSQMLALAVGPLVGSVVGAASMRLLFLGACGLALAAVVPLASALPPGGIAGRVAVPAGDRPHPALAHPAVPHPAAPWHGRLASPTILGVALAFAAVGLLTGVYESCWTLLLRLRHATTVDVGLSWTLFALPYAVLSVPAGRLAQRLDRRLLTVGALLSSAGFCLLYPFLHDVALLVGLGVAEAVGAVVGGPPAVLVLSEAVPAARQGAAQGVAETARTATTAVAAAASGILFGIGPVLPFAVGAIASAAVAGAVWWLWRAVPERSPVQVARPAPLGGGAGEAPSGVDRAR